MCIKDYQFVTAKAFNKMLRDAEHDIDRERIKDIAFKGICLHCGAVIDDGRCYCMRDD